MMQQALLEQWASSYDSSYIEESQSPLVVRKKSNSTKHPAIYPEQSTS